MKMQKGLLVIALLINSSVFGMRHLSFGMQIFVLALAEQEKEDENNFPFNPNCYQCIEMKDFKPKPFAASRTYTKEYAQGKEKNEYRLWHALRTHNLQEVIDLLASGADSNKQAITPEADKPYAPLSYVLYIPKYIPDKNNDRTKDRMDYSIALALLKYKADANNKDWLTDYPLIFMLKQCAGKPQHDSAYDEKVAVIKKLIEYGAKKDIESASGQTVQQLINEIEDEGVRAQLLELIKK